MFFENKKKYVLDRKTEESLKVFFPVEGGHEEVNGITLYGLWKGLCLDEPKIPEIKQLGETDCSSSRLWGYDPDKGTDWNIWLWDIWIKDWDFNDSTWVETLKSFFVLLEEQGALVSWSALDSVHSDPPGLFDPASMSCGVHAAYSKDTGFIVKSHIGKNLEVLTDDEMLLYKKVLDDNLPLIKKEEYEALFK